MQTKLLRHQDGNPYIWPSSLFDISERKAAEEALQESMERYRLFVENNRDAMFIVQDNTIKFPNSMAMMLFGYSKEKLSMIPFTSHIHPDYRKKVVDRNVERLAGEKTTGTDSFKIINNQKEELWVQLNATPVIWEGIPAILCSLRDITSLKNMEIQLHQAHKLEAIGMLASGIAHDFVNILTIMIGYIQMCIKDLSKTSPQFENLNQALKAGCRAKDLISQVLSLSNMDEGEEEIIDVRLLIQEVIGFLKPTLPGNINIRQYLKTEAKFIKASPVQMHQLLMNLSTNAIDAMKETGGILRINLAIVKTDTKFATLHPGSHPELYLKLTVSDTGQGITPDIMEKIYDPYFTTKGKTNGMGLGLFVVLGIVKKHGGIITINSQTGKGSTFQVYLPTVEP